jgi:hypothetical protein
MLAEKATREQYVKAFAASTGLYYGKPPSFEQNPARTWKLGRAPLSVGIKLAAHHHIAGVLRVLRLRGSARSAAEEDQGYAGRRSPWPWRPGGRRPRSSQLQGFSSRLPHGRARGIVTEWAERACRLGERGAVEPDRHRRARPKINS